MKKLISFMILIALSVSLFGCAKAPIDSASPDVLVENKRLTDDALPATDVQTPDETADQTPQESADGADADTESDYSATVTPAVTLPSVTVKQNEGESAKPMVFTKDDQFSSFEVAVLLTEEETNKNKTYSVADFEGYDIFNVAEYNCYPKEFYPEHEGKKGLVLYLNEPSKERVLEYCEKLSKDPRIAIAEPNINPVSFGRVAITLSELGKEKYQTILIKWFDGSLVTSGHIPSGKNGDIFLIFDNPLDEKSYCEQLKILCDNKYIDTIRSDYNRITNKISVNITHERYAQNKEFTAKDFPEIDVKKISEIKILNVEDKDGKTVETDEYCTLTLTVEPTKFIHRIVKDLQNNPIIKKAYVKTIPSFVYKLQSMDTCFLDLWFE